MSPDVLTVLRAALVVLAVLGGLWVLYQLGTLIVLLAYSVLFAYLVAPVVDLVQRRLVLGPKKPTLPRGIAVAVAYLLVLGAVALLVTWIVPQVSDAAKQLPQRMQSLKPSSQTFSKVFGWLQVIGLSGSMIDSAVSAAIGGLDTGARRVASAFVSVAAYVPWLVLIPILAFLLLKDAEALRQGAIGVLPERWRPRAADLVDRIDAALAAYIRAQLVACVIVGTIVGVGFTVLRVPFAAVLGVVAGLAEFLPLVGPLAIAVVSAVTAALSAPVLALWVLFFLGVLRVIQDYVIYPRLVGSNIHLHPLAVILAVLAGAELGGVVGVLLSVPVLAIMSAVYRCFRDASGHRNRPADR